MEWRPPSPAGLRFVTSQCSKSFSAPSNPQQAGRGSLGHISMVPLPGGDLAQVLLET